MAYRSKRLLNFAKDAPHCFGCGKANAGDVVAAHANWSEYGKGMAHKAHDWAVAMICGDCHWIIDSSGSSRADKKEAWRMAHVKTLAWLFETGRVAPNEG